MSANTESINQERMQTMNINRVLLRRDVGRLFKGMAVVASLAPVSLRLARAAALPAPEGKVILKISGSIANSNDGNSAAFDMSMIEKLGTQSFTTKTPWYKEPVTFSGVAMSTLLDFVGAKGTTLSVTALNDYATDIPIADFKTYPVILATKRDGSYMPVRDKGPLFIVYNYDSNVELQHQRFYSRSAWQVARMVVK
jgi:hypothetical protein